MLLSLHPENVEEVFHGYEYDVSTSFTIPFSTRETRNSPSAAAPQAITFSVSKSCHA